MNTNTNTDFTSAQHDRIAGTLVGCAAGDALGAGYEFGPSIPADEPVGMIGGGLGPFAPGEWTDDTQMMQPIAWAALEGDLRDGAVQDQIVADWREWAKSAKDVGIQTRTVLGSLKHGTSAEAFAASKAHHQRTGRSGGNGALMRTAPVALAFLDDPEGLALAARQIAQLTHWDPDAGDSCVLWCLAIRHAILHGEFNLRGGVQYLRSERQAVWIERINEAESKTPTELARKNGWTVAALQAAWSAIVNTPVPTDRPARHFQLGIEAAVRGGKDTDTVAAIAGALLGARWGATALPSRWQRVLHGWPTRKGEPTRAADLIALGSIIARRLDPNSPTVWPAAARIRPKYDDLDALEVHPWDEGVILGGFDSLHTQHNKVDAVVSLCRVGHSQRPKGVPAERHIQVWLLDEPDHESNVNLDFVLLEAADAVAAFRAEGHTVLLQCVAAHSRTPTVAALYANRHLGVPMKEAVETIVELLPYAWPNPGFRRALQRLEVAV